MNQTTRLFLAAVFALSLSGCLAEAPGCVSGDQEACRCGDGTFGYRTCAMRSDGTGHAYGGCDCVIGLSPDAGPLGTPYMSGHGSGSGTHDAGGP